MGEDKYIVRGRQFTVSGPDQLFVEANPARILLMAYALTGFASVTIRPVGIGWETTGIPVPAATGLELYYSRHGPLVGCKFVVNGLTSVGLIEVLLNPSYPGAGSADPTREVFRG